MKLDFEHDIRHEIVQRLPHDPAHNSELLAMPVGELLVLYLNWLGRQIMPRPRQVNHSWEFTASSLRFDPRYRSGIDQIIQTLETGGNLKPHLSRDIEVGYEPPRTPPTRRRRRHLDLLLNDRLVHHLHLSTTMRKDGFVKRDGPLLFAVIGKDEAFLLDILDHNSFSRERIAHIMIDNWPNSNFVHRLADLTPERTVSDEERHALRKAGINAGFIERHGHHYFVGFGGISGAGTSAQHARLANLIRRGVRAFEDHVAANPDYIKDVLRHNGVTPAATTDIHFIIRSDGWFAIRENNTRVTFDIPGVPREQG